MQKIRCFEALLAAAAIGFVLTVPSMSFAIGPETPVTVPPPKSTTSSQSTTAKPAPKKPAVKVNKKKDQQTLREYEDNYRTAYKMIYTDHDYAAGIAKLHSLNNDDNADIANLIGYSSRKLGRYEDFEILVRKSARRRSAPCPHLVLLRHVARRTGKHAEGAGLSRNRAQHLRHRLQGIYRAEGRDRGHAYLLTASRQTLPAGFTGVRPALLSPRSARQDTSYRRFRSE